MILNLDLLNFYKEGRKELGESRGRELGEVEGR